MTSLFRDGDILLTYGKGGLWPPRRMVMWLVYRQIRRFQYYKWVSHFKMKDADYSPTHVRIFLNGKFFEATVPNCQWVSIEDLQLSKKKWKLVRSRHWEDLDIQKMLAIAQEFEGRPYDRGDLVDFALSGLLGRWKHSISLFGDREQKMRVCSTMGAYILNGGGLEFSMPITSIDPAYYVNMKKEFIKITQDE